MTSPAALPALPPEALGWSRLRRPIWLFDPVSCHGLYANAPAMELWGAESLQELLSRDFSKLSPAVRTRVERLAQATAQGEAVFERWTFYPRGEPLTVQALISAFPMPDGRQVLLFEAAPIEVEEDERRAVEALRHTSSLITLFGAGGEAIFSNPAAFDAYGAPGPGFSERFAEADLGAGVLARALAGEVVAELCRMVTAGGLRWHHLDVRQTLDPVTGRSGVLCSERDVTAQIEAEQALLAAHERAEVAEAKERFLANMSHELRTPLTSVLGFAGLLDQGDLDPVQRSHVARIAEAGATLQTVINDVILLSELDSGEVRLEPDAFAPEAMLAEALSAVRSAAEAKGLDLRLEIAPDAPGRLIGDQGRLARVVGEYLTNAVKFTEAGAVTLSLGWAEAPDGAAAIEIAVADTGPGVSEAEMGRLFRRFSQADQSMRKRHGGGGLGLAICRELIALMGGEVGVDSAAGEGSRFWCRVTLPVCDALPDVEADAEPAALRVLYADDHANNRLLVQAILGAQGHHCEGVCDGAEAVDAARGGGWDLILMDIQMPVLDGVAAARAIRALEGAAGAVPILALTANTLSEQRAAYAAAGMADCIAKPVNVAELVAKVTRWARSAPAQASAVSHKRA